MPNSRIGPGVLQKAHAVGRMNSIKESLRALTLLSAMFLKVWFKAAPHAIGTGVQGVSAK
jgi:hypothetical protein